MKALFLFLPALLPLAALSCAGDTIPAGLRATPPGTGPTVVFDLAHRPLPEIPLPNDVATFPDPTSRTGLRLNASIVAPTNFERVARQGFDTMEGWGTYQPISVAFTRDPSADPADAAIDLDNVRTRMQNDGYDFSNDPVYLINLTTGLPVPLDVGEGNFPNSVSETGKYYPNDPKGAEQNLFFETVEEGAGLTQADYRPSLDKDFDGVLDHPNTLGSAKEVQGVDNLMTWYERETDTLIVRPLIPLEEKTAYAVVLTDRLTGKDGQAVRSPFPSIHHPQQRASVARVVDAINDKARSAYYGDLAGTGLAHVAFAWTYTTEPVFEDMRLLRDGLYGQGPFARFAKDFPPKATLFRAVGKTVDDAAEPPGWQQDPTCAVLNTTPYSVKFDVIKSTLNEFFSQVFGYHGEPARLLEDTVANIDHVVIGTFQSPYLMGDPASPDPDSSFHLDFKTGAGDVSADAVHFYIAVPKETATLKQPFPVTFWGHGVTGHDDESIVYAGHFAKRGVATIGIDAPEHGLVLDAGTRALSQSFLAQACVAPWISGVAGGRAHDLNFDGIPDSGGLWWTAHMVHTRDNVRQAILDAMQATRLLRSFDGTNLADQDYNGDGKPDLAGDFDADGRPDLGGPNVKYYASGESLGGLLSEIQGGIDPFVSATAPVSGGGGGGMDIATRSYGVAEAVLLQVLSPLVIAIPATERAPDSNGHPQTQCKDAQTSVRFFVNDLTGSKEIELACVDRADLAGQMTVVLTNLATKERRCVRTLDDTGRFRVPIPASIGDKLDIQIYNTADVVDSYKTCNVPDGTPVGRRIHTFEVAATSFSPVADSNKMCPPDAANGCQQFRDTFYPAGTDTDADPRVALVAPQEGLGLSRQTPEFRRLMNLVQAAFDPADPINYAPYYMLRPLPGTDGVPVPPHALLSVNTVGDGYVNVATGNAFARAAGAVPFFPPSATKSFPEYTDYATPQALYDAWGKTANRMLIDNAVLEGISRFGRTPAGPACDVNYVPSGVCTATPKKDPLVCQNSLADTDWLSEGAQHYDQQHPSTPLRLGRDATVRPVDPTTLAAAWGPRLSGTPFSSTDPGAWANPIVADLNLYITPLGQHSYDTGDPCQAFNTPFYIDSVMARFFASNGTDLYYLSHPHTHRCLATEQGCP